MNVLLVFRGTYGGLHKVYGVNPDMAIFGKAIGNGYAINAVIGKKEIMNMANETFISSTFWTEKNWICCCPSNNRGNEKKLNLGKKVNSIGKKIKKFLVRLFKKISFKNQYSRYGFFTIFFDKF